MDIRWIVKVSGKLQGAIDGEVSQIAEQST
jgi:hypothetical protein